MTIQIMMVTTANAHILKPVDPDVFDHEIDEACLAEYLRAPNHVMCIATKDALVVGQARAIIHFHPDQRPELYIDNVGVAPAFQRNGIATRMVEQIVLFGKERGCTEIWLGTEPDNEPAKALYRSMGLSIQDMVMFDGKIDDSHTPQKA